MSHKLYLLYVCEHIPHIEHMETMNTHPTSTTPTHCHNTPIGNFRISFILEYCTNNTADGIHTSTWKQNWSNVTGKRSCNNRQVFSFYLKVDMHSYLIQNRHALTSHILSRKWGVRIVKTDWTDSHWSCQIWQVIWNMKIILITLDGYARLHVCWHCSEHIQ